MVQFATDFTGTSNGLDLGEVDDGVVGSGVAITSTDGFGVAAIGASHYIAILGSVSAGLDAIGVSAGYVTRIQVGRTGSLLGHNNGISVTGDATRIVNSGEIMGMLGNGITLALSGGAVATTNTPPSPDGYVVRNFGAISGTIAISAADARLNLYNTGQLTGLGGDAVKTGTGNDLVKNYGDIAGNVSLGLGNDLLYNRGHIDGGVDTGAGVDVFDNRGGWVSGQIQLGDGDDTFRPGAESESASGGSGVDTLDFASGGPVRVSLDGSFVNGAGADGDSYVGFENIIGSHAGADLFTGNDLANKIVGFGGNDVVYGRGGVDFLDGGEGNDRLYGEAGSDTIFGGDGADTVDGGAGNDKLSGDDGTDIVNGGAGADILFGGANADRFVYDAASASNLATVRDHIVDFSHDDGDRIDLSAIDAIKATAANEAFTFIGSAAFHNVAGELRFEVGTVVTSPPLPYVVVSGDTNGDGVADFSIEVYTVNSLVAGDFVL